MKIHTDSAASGHRITGYGDDFVAVDEQVVRHSMVVLSDRLLHDWVPAGRTMPDADALLQLTRLGVDIVLLGTGRRQRFPSAEEFAVVTAAGVGLEVMDTPAACRTYNILAGEGRLVAAALLIGVD